LKEFPYKLSYSNYIFSKYQKAADNLRENILTNYYNGHKAKDVLFEKISEVIGD